MARDRLTLSSWFPTWGSNAKYLQKHSHPANIYLFKVNNKNTKKQCDICSKLTLKTPERGL